MAIECTVDTLTEDAACFTNVSAQQLLGILVYLQCQQTDMDCDVETLLDSSKCFSNVSSQQLLGIVAYMQCQIFNGGGTGGAQELYWDRDPAPPDDATKPALSISTTGGPMTYWNGAAWV